MRPRVRARDLAPVPFAIALASCSSSSSGNGPAAFTQYAPQGCAYTVTPPASRGYEDLALDDPKATGDAPLRVRIGLGGGTTMGQPGYADPSTSAVFTWETANPTHAAELRIGSDPGSLTDVHTGYSWSISPANFHEVHVCGLTPGHSYYYEVGGGAAGGAAGGAWSATQTFSTPSASGKVLVGLSGDSRDDANIFQLVQLRMRDAAVDMQITSGDLVLLGVDESLYGQWLDGIWKDPNDTTKFLTLGQMPMLFIGGNHENQSAEYFANFALPGDGNWAETYGSFFVGSVHFVLINDEAIAAGTSADETSTQLAWLDQDLAAADADRAAHPFVVVLHHRSVFSTAPPPGHSMDSDVLAARTQLSPIFAKHHVDLVVNGHDHEYERTAPIVPAANPTDAPMVQASTSAGTTYVICAGSGAMGYAPGKTAVPWRAINVGFGTGTPYVGVYSLLTIDGGTLSLKAYGLKAAGGGVAGDDVIDTLDLKH
jgi:hypothetical protein